MDCFRRRVRRLQSIKFLPLKLLVPKLFKTGVITVLKLSTVLTYNSFLGLPTGPQIRPASSNCLSHTHKPRPTTTRRLRSTQADPLEANKVRANIILLHTPSSHSLSSSIANMGEPEGKELCLFLLDVTARSGRPPSYDGASFPPVMMVG